MPRNRSWSASLTHLLSSSSSSSRNTPDPAADRDMDLLKRNTFASLSTLHSPNPGHDSPPPPKAQTGMRSVSRPMSLLQPYNPPRVDVERETLPELQPIFSFMNNHSEKVYTDGYFLKLTDLLPDGKPAHDRNWMECFGQLKGNVLLLWNAAELDAAEMDVSGRAHEEVVPTFLNLTDASIKMIEKLPTKSPGAQPLMNILSISTAGRNRFLFHFNSHHSLAQWTASIRLAMFEHSKLQEIYTGALIAAKGRTLNAIKEITQPTRFKYEDWVRVRFGAGTPWRKCWAVISQPDEKAVKKAKAIAKKAKNTAYEQRPVLKGTVKFYDSNKKTKKQQPIATMVDAFAAYAVYPQSKELIDHSSLVKIEGRIIIHGDQPTESEGFVFVMPDSHPMVSGFEMMLRFMFPTFDTFALYGRPGMLIADRSDPRGLMFAMPREMSTECGYLDVVDVVNVIVQNGQNIKQESEWRAKLKELSHDKLKLLEGKPQRPRTSLPAVGKGGQLTFQNGVFPTQPLKQDLDIPPQHVPFRTPPPSPGIGHQRSASEATGLAFARAGQQRSASLVPSSLNPHYSRSDNVTISAPSEDSSDDGLFQGPIDPAARHLQAQSNQPPPEPVPVTPITTHPPSSRPQQPLQSPRAPPAGFGEDDEDNLFAGVVPPRNDRRSYHESLQPPTGNQYYQSPNSPRTPQAEAEVEAPPGYALQSSHVLLRGPPPQNDDKSGYDVYANQPPQGHPAEQYGYRSRTAGSSGLPSPRDSPAPGGPSRPPPLGTSVERKPVPTRSPRPGSPNDDENGPDEELRAHLIDQGALARIGTGPHAAASRDDDSVVIFDEDTLDRKAMERIQRVLQGQDADSESEYEDDEESEPDYASVDSVPPPTKRDVDQPRAGRMKVVGSQTEQEVKVGDVTYRPPTAVKTLDPLANMKIDIPEVNFGTTFSHGRSLSRELKDARGNPTKFDADTYPVSQHGTLMNGTLMNGTLMNGTLMNGTLPGSTDPRRLSPNNLTPDGHHPHHVRANSRGSGRSDPPHPSPRGESHGSSSDGNTKRHSVAWTPGATAPGPLTPELTLTPEQYIAGKAAAAQAETRNRYLHKRRSSGQLLNTLAPSPAPGHYRHSSHEHLPPRPASRGGNAAFMPHGLVSTPDLSAHLSAREQEFVARTTGSTLLQMDDAQKPPHKAGLIGAIQSREQEKQVMKGAFAQGRLPANLTVQQEIARRQQQQQQKEMHSRRTTPSPRPLSLPFDQQSYFPPQGQGNQYYAPQPLQQEGGGSYHQRAQSQTGFYQQGGTQSQFQLGTQSQHQLGAGMGQQGGYGRQSPSPNFQNGYYGR